VKIPARGANVGTFFRYAVEHPVSLPKQRSAMLPIVNHNVQTKRKAVYNQDTDAKHPMTALELTNSTKLHLMQGPITLFDGGEYAGDAQIEDLAPQTKRLVTYALDLNTEVIAAPVQEFPKDFTSVTIRNGFVSATKFEDRKHSYTIKNSNPEPRQVVIEQSIESEWRLISPEKPSEQTHDLYRFVSDAPPGKSVSLIVSERRDVHRRIAIATRTPFGAINADADRADAFGEIKATDADREAGYLLARSVKDKSPALQEALTQWREKHQAIVKTDGQISQIGTRVDEIGREQARIRQNMMQLPEESDLYRKYLTNLSELEEELGTLRAERMKLAALLSVQKSGLNNYLLELNVD
jgi:hypothetical protein